MELADTHRTSSSNPLYLDLALRLWLPIATLDRTLARAAEAEGVEVP